MGIGLFYDVAAVAIILWFIAKGYRSGLLASVLRLMGKLVSFFGALYLSRPVAQMAYLAFVKNRLVAYVDKAILDNPALTDMLEGLEGVMVFFADKAASFSSIVRTFDRLPGAFGGAQEVGAYAQAESRLIEMMNDGATLSEAIAEAALSPTILLILQAVAFLVLFLALSLLVGWLAGLLGVVNRIPVVGTFNGLLGGALGAGEALIAIYILGVILSLVIAATGGYEYLSVEILESTRLLRKIIYFTLP